MDSTFPLQADNNNQKNDIKGLNCSSLLFLPRIARDGSSIELFAVEDHDGSACFFSGCVSNCTGALPFTVEYLRPFRSTSLLTIGFQLGECHAIRYATDPNRFAGVYPCFLPLTFATPTLVAPIFLFEMWLPS